MRYFIFTIGFSLTTFLSLGQNSFNVWVDSVKKALETNNVNQLKEYSLYQIDENVEIDFVAVRALEVVEIESSIIKLKMIGFDGIIKGCIWVEYLKCNEGYFMVFGGLKTIQFGDQSIKVITPWKRKDSNCI